MKKKITFIFLFCLLWQELRASYSTSPINRSMRVHNPSALSWGGGSKNLGLYYSSIAHTENQTVNTIKQYDFENETSYSLLGFADLDMVVADFFYRNLEDTGKQYIDARVSVDKKKEEELQINGAINLGPLSLGLGYLSVQNEYESTSPLSTATPIALVTKKSGYLVGLGGELFGFNANAMVQFLQEEGQYTPTHNYTKMELGGGLKQGLPEIGVFHFEGAYLYTPESKSGSNSFQGYHVIPLTTEIFLEGEFEYEVINGDLAVHLNIQKRSQIEKVNYTASSERKTETILLGVGSSFFYKKILANYSYKKEDVTFGNMLREESSHLLTLGVQF